MIEYCSQPLDIGKHPVHDSRHCALCGSLLGSTFSCGYVLLWTISSASSRVGDALRNSPGCVGALSVNSADSECSHGISINACEAAGALETITLHPVIWKSGSGHVRRPGMQAAKTTKTLFVDPLLTIPSAS